MTLICQSSAIVLHGNQYLTQLSCAIVQCMKQKLELITICSSTSHLITACKEQIRFQIAAIVTICNKYAEEGSAYIQLFQTRANICITRGDASCNAVSTCAIYSYDIDHIMLQLSHYLHLCILSVTRHIPCMLSINCCGHWCCASAARCCCFTWSIEP
jgi:hypothetical protein